MSGGTPPDTAAEPRRRRPAAARRLYWFGPAFIAAIAYVDPGNFVTNFSSGAQFGYTLLWVVLTANLVAMLIQSLTAKLGLVTGRDLAQLCRDRMPTGLRLGMWAQAELVAMATDLAEILGGALALHLLAGVPLLAGGAITCLVAFALLALQQRGHRRYELVIVGMLAVILAGILYNLLLAGIDPADATGGLAPRLAGGDQMLLAAGIVGATVMPHVIYLHSALPNTRNPDRNDAAGLRRALRMQRWDTTLALGVAGVINAAMLLIAARVFHPTSATDVTVDDVHSGLGQTLGTAAATAFALALLASGFASSSVGTYAGQVVMQGFLRRRVPLLVRRLVTMLPPLAVLATGVDPTTALIWSQVVLAFGVPFALIPLILLTRRRDVMGEFVNSRLVTSGAALAGGLIILLNVLLIAQLVRAG